MKICRPGFLALMLAICGSAPLPAQESNLSPDYLRILSRADLMFRKENYEEVLKLLDHADKIQLDTTVALNMRGAVYTEEGKFAEARKYFDQALKLAPQFFAPRFNLGEILFMTKDYDAAREHFEKMLKDMPDNEILEYKVSLCYLMQGNNASAQEWIDKIKFPSDTPAYYFAHAAWDFKKGKDADARQWIDSSMRIFGPESNFFFLRSLADLGWVDREMVKTMQLPRDGSTDQGSTSGPGGVPSVSGAAEGREAPKPAPDKPPAGQ